MSPVARLHRLAFRMGVDVHELVLRRFRRDSAGFDAVIEGGVIRIRPTAYCNPRLDDGWKPVYGTVITNPLT